MIRNEKEYKFLTGDINGKKILTYSIDESVASGDFAYQLVRA